MPYGQHGSETPGVAASSTTTYGIPGADEKRDKMIAAITSALIETREMSRPVARACAPEIADAALNALSE